MVVWERVIIMDIDNLLNTIQFRFAEGKDLNTCLAFDHVKDTVRLHYKIMHKEIILAESFHVAIGYLRLDHLWLRLPFIGLIRLKPAFQGHGVGTKLLAFLENHLRSQGATMLLSSSQANEPRPQRWHRARGFKECGTLEGVNEDGVDEIFFVKKLAS